MGMEWVLCPSNPLPTLLQHQRLTYMSCLHGLACLLAMGPMWPLGRQAEIRGGKRVKLEYLSPKLSP